MIQIYNEHSQGDIVNEYTEEMKYTDMCKHTTISKKYQQYSSKLTPSKYIA